LQAGHTLSKIWRSLSISQNRTSECPGPMNMHIEQDAASFHYQSFTSTSQSSKEHG
jgi:hypothetical protein